MKKLLIILSVVLAFASCKKEDFGSYHAIAENTANEPHDSTTYVYGGTLPTSTSSSNDLIGTQWVLTKYVSEFATEYPFDTLTFVTANQYTINGGAVRTYQLGSLPLSNNLELSIYYFFPFGGSHYSGEVGGMFIDDGQIDNVEFIDIQNSSSTIKAWFVKL